MRLSINSVDDLPAGFWRWQHIDPVREWACKGTGQLVIDTPFLDRVEALRDAVGRPLIITSGYRSPEHNRAVSSTGLTGPHTTGRAVDIRVYGLHALQLVVEARRLGFTGIGVSQKGAHTARFIHLDDLPSTGWVRPTIWSY